MYDSNGKDYGDLELKIHIPLKQSHVWLYNLFQNPTSLWPVVTKEENVAIYRRNIDYYSKSAIW